MASKQNSAASRVASSLEDDLVAAFDREAASAVRALFFARRADLEGRADIAATLRSIADGELSQAFGHLELLDDLAPGSSGGDDAEGDLATVIAAEEEAQSRYRDLSAAARTAGRSDAAVWFESLATAEAAHLLILRRASAASR
ncbi:MAG: ferritin family protein [Candidatus Dormibacteria bacterium]